MIENLSKEEILNAHSYAKSAQLAVYDTEKIKPIEELLFEKWFPGSIEKVLDIGCGGGRTTIYLKKRGYDVIGIDLVPEMIDMAKRKYPTIDFRVMNACNLAFPDQSFDTVFFSFNGLDCIYPEEKRWRAVSEIKRVLKSEGKLILSSHNSIVWPRNKYIWFWWFINIFSGKIFTSYRYEYKQFKQGVKFIYFARRPSRQIKDFTMRGFKLLDIIACTLQKNFLGKTPTRGELRALDLKEEWPYFVFEKLT